MPNDRTLGPHMPFYVDRFLGGTMAFEAHEIGAYLLLIAHQWQHGSIENDQRMIERVARCEFSKLRRVLEKFRIVDDKLVNQTCEKVRIDRLVWLEDQARRAKMGGDARWDANRHSNRDANRDAKAYAHTDTDTDTVFRNRKPTPTPTSSEADGGCGGGGLLADKSMKKSEIIALMQSARPAYATIRAELWEGEMKVEGATPEIIAAAANTFLAADINRTDELKVPARYFGGILKKTMEESGLYRESIEDKIKRMNRGGK